MGKPYTYCLASEALRSAVIPLASGGVTINLPVVELYRHNFSGVNFYNDANGDTPVTPTGGTITFTLKTPLQPNAYQSFPSNLVNAADDDQVSWSTNTLEVQAVIAGIVGATHARLNFMGNIS